jgi:C-3',4' desaturase CrtD
MQVLSERLVEGLEKYGGQLRLGQRVEKIATAGGQVTEVTVRHQKTGEIWREPAGHVIANVTAQNLLELLGNSPSPLPNRYRRRIEQLTESAGAFVVYLGVKETAIPAGCPPHLQFLYDGGGPIGENNSLFVSVSQPGDGRAPAGKRTIVASSFTAVSQWWQITEAEYEARKQQYTQQAITRLGQYFSLDGEAIVHQEAATPRTFARFTARTRGIVGGIGQRVATFGPLGIATRTPVRNLWLVGDSTHPGEGTAGVSYSALTAVRQIARF